MRFQAVGQSGQQNARHGDESNQVHRFHYFYFNFNFLFGRIDTLIWLTNLARQLTWAAAAPDRRYSRRSRTLLIKQSINQTIDGYEPIDCCSLNRCRAIELDLDADGSQPNDSSRDQSGRQRECKLSIENIPTIRLNRSIHRSIYCLVVGWCLVLFAWASQRQRERERENYQRGFELIESKIGRPLVLTATLAIGSRAILGPTNLAVALLLADLVCKFANCLAICLASIEMCHDFGLNCVGPNQRTRTLEANASRVGSCIQLDTSCQRQ